MKIDRLIGILSVLLQREKITAPELAEKFEVSRRTINRDIEDLCRAGIPIVTTQGVTGGISIMDGYRMDRTLLSTKDMQMILAGLRSLDSVSGSQYYGQLMEKMQAGSSELMNGTSSILIDLSAWDRERLAPKIQVIQDAIELKRTLCFSYYGPAGDSQREIEPYYLIFKWNNWYVYGYCYLRNDFRMFKLNRMSLPGHGISFASGRQVPLPDLERKKTDSTNELTETPKKELNGTPKEKTVGTQKDNRSDPFKKSVFKALFNPSLRWKLIEEFGIDSFTVEEDGRLLFEHTYEKAEDLISWMLSCRNLVTVVEPESIRKDMLRITSELAEKYKNQ